MKNKKLLELLIGCFLGLKIVLIMYIIAINPNNIFYFLFILFIPCLIWCYLHAKDLFK